MKPFATVAVVVFGLIALMHLIRLILAWEVTVNGLHVPVWLSGVAFLIMAGLAVLLWHEAR